MTWFDEFSELTKPETVTIRRRVSSLRGQPVYSGEVEFSPALTVYTPRRVVTDTGEETTAAGDVYIAPAPVVRTIDQLELADGSLHRIIAIDRYQDERMEPGDALQRLAFI